MFKVIILLILIIIIFGYVHYYRCLRENFTGSNFNIVKGYYVPEVLTEKSPAKSLNECIDVCDTDISCTGITLAGDQCLKFKSEKIPQLKKANNAFYNPYTAIKQQASCSSIADLFGGTCFEGKDFPGGDLLGAPYYVNTDNMTLCAEKCMATKDCIGISYSPILKRCFIKKKMDSKVGNPAKDRVSWKMPVY